jgi:hypothetical protein
VKGPADLGRLAALAALVSDARIRTLSTRRAACARTQARIDALDTPPAPAAGEPDAATRAGAQALHARWAARQRAMLNVALARETAQALVAQDAARLAFGRARALQRLAEAAAAARKRRDPP